MTTLVPSYNNMTDPVILKSNALVDSEYYLTLNQSRLLYCCLAQVQPKSDVNTKYRVYASDFAKIFDINAKNAYRELKESADSLYENEIVMYSDELKKKRRLRWIYEAVYHEGEGAVDIAFSPDIVPYISRLERDYVMVRLYMSKKFKKSYSFRLYEIACRYCFRGDKYFELEEFKELMRLSTKYERWYDLEKYVIKPGCREVTEHTDRNLFYEPIKKGRKTIGINFNMSTKDSFKVEASKQGEPSLPPEYAQYGYRSMNEYAEAKQLEAKYNVTFANADEYFRFTLKIKNEEAHTDDLFEEDSKPKPSRAMDAFKSA